MSVTETKKRKRANRKREAILNTVLDDFDDIEAESSLTSKGSDISFTPPYPTPSKNVNELEINLKTSKGAKRNGLNRKINDNTEAKTKDVTEANTIDVTETNTKDVTEAKTKDVTEAKTKDVTEAKTKDVTEEARVKAETFEAETVAGTLVEDDLYYFDILIAGLEPSHRKILRNILDNAKINKESNYSVTYIIAKMPEQLGMAASTIKKCILEMSENKTGCGLLKLGSKNPYSGKPSKKFRTLTISSKLYNYLEKYLVD